MKGELELRGDVKEAKKGRKSIIQPKSWKKNIFKINL